MTKYKLVVARKLRLLNCYNCVCERKSDILKSFVVKLLVLLFFIAEIHTEMQDTNQQDICSELRVMVTSCLGISCH